MFHIKYENLTIGQLYDYQFYDLICDGDTKTITAELKEGWLNELL